MHLAKIVGLLMPRLALPLPQQRQSTLTELKCRPTGPCQVCQQRGKPGRAFIAHRWLILAPSAPGSPGPGILLLLHPAGRALPCTNVSRFPGKGHRARISHHPSSRQDRRSRTGFHLPTGATHPARNRISSLFLFPRATRYLVCLSTAAEAC